MEEASGSGSRHQEGLWVHSSYPRTARAGGARTKLAVRDRCCRGHLIPDT